jgi:hypothetical protein
LALTILAFPVIKDEGTVMILLGVMNLDNLAMLVQDSFG